MATTFRPQAAVALAGLVLIGLLLAAGAGSSSAFLPRSGDTYVEAMIGAPRLVNPLLAQSDTDLDLTHLIFSGLTRVDERGAIVPDLASGWQASPDSSVFTFTLRSGLLWSDDKPLTSDDIAFTVGLLKDPHFPGDPALASHWRDVQLDTISPLIVQFKLPSSNSSFLEYTTLGILPRHRWTDVQAPDLANSDLNRTPVGAGQWRYTTPGTIGIPGGAAVTTGSADSQGTSDTPGDALHSGVLLEPNPNRLHRAMRISRLWFRFYPTFDAAVAGLKAGEVHGLGHIPADRLADMQAMSGVEMHQQTLARSAMLLLNLRSPLFDKPQTRQAVELAISRKALVEQTLHMQARVTDSPILAQSWAYSSRAVHGGYSPVEARRLFDEAGWLTGPDGIRARNGERLSVVLAANKEVPSNIQVARELQSQLQAAGIEIKLALVGRDRLLKEYLAPGAFHMVLVNWEAQGAEPDIYDYWHTPQRGLTSYNFVGWSNPQADKALDEARVSSDNWVRAARYAEFQQAFKEDVPAVVLYNSTYSYLTRADRKSVV